MKLSLTSVVTTLFILLVTAATSIMLYTYMGSLEETASILWNKAARNASDLAKIHTVKNIRTAEPLLYGAQRQVSLGHLDIHNDQQMIDWTFNLALNNPEFAFVGFARANDEAIYTGRIASGNFYSAIHTLLPQNHTSPKGQVTEINEFQYDEFLRRSLIKTAPNGFIPSKRPWHQQAVKNKGISIVDPYLYSGDERTGTTISLPQYSDGQLAGVWFVDFTYAQLSKYLATLEVMPSSKVIVLSKKGDVIGHPDSMVIRGEDGKPQVSQVSNHPDPVLKPAWDAGQLDQLNGMKNFEFDGWLAAAQLLPVLPGVDWIILTMVPKTSVFADVEAQMKQTTSATIAVALIGLGLIWLISTRVKRYLKQLTTQLLAIARLDFDKPAPTELAQFSEIDMINRSIKRMQQGLRSFEKYIQKDVVKELINQNIEPEPGGVTKTLTMMFIDLADFTKKSESLSPNEIAEYLSVFFEVSCRAIEYTGGTIDKFVGDSVVAFWGAPKDLANHQEAAVQAAVLINEKLSVLDGMPYRIRIGINTGDVMVGNIGSKKRINYTIIGDPVNLASRLESSNKVFGTQILISQSTRDGLSDKYVLRELDEIYVKGKSQAILVYDVQGPIQGASKRQIETADQFNRAMADYRAKNYADALSFFELLDCKASHYMANKCREALGQPNDSFQGAA
jgi:adenylate cyclase